MPTSWKVPLADVHLGDEERQGVLRVLDSTWLTMGEVTRGLEKEFADYLGAAHAIAVSSGSAALHIAAKLVGLGPGDEVITPALTFVASVNAMVYEGARPVFVDVRTLDDWTIDPDATRAKITPRTRAICVVHYGGYLCDMDAVLEIARQHGLAVIEDAAHAPGASDRGRSAGTFGDVGCFSFFANKNMTSAEGGMVITGREDWAERALRLRSHGMTTVTWQRHAGHAWSYDVLELGYNYRITDLHAAIGIAQLHRLEQNNARRKQLVLQYRERLDGLSMVSLPFAAARGLPAHHICPILLGAEIDRQFFMQAMRARGIQTSVHYPPVHRFRWYREHFPVLDALPLTELIGERMVTLPLFPTMGEADVDYVADAVRELAHPQ